jgi:hypothetical protein
MSADLGLVSAITTRLLEEAGMPILYRETPWAEPWMIAPEDAGRPAGLLPAFLVTAEALWRSAGGQGFGLAIHPDREALLGYRVTRIGAASASTVLLTLMETVRRVSSRDGILVEELGEVWRVQQARGAGRAEFRRLRA